MIRNTPPLPTDAVAALDADIDTLRQDHEQATRALCQRAREQFVIPFCERTGLRLYVNGIDWGFVLCGTSVLIGPEQRHQYPELAEIFAVLTRELTGEENGATVATYQAEYVPASYGRGTLPASVERVIPEHARHAADAPALASDERLPLETLRQTFETDFREAADTAGGGPSFDPLERDASGDYVLDLARLGWAAFQRGYVAACERYEADPAWRIDEREFQRQRQSRYSDEASAP